MPAATFSFSVLFLLLPFSPLHSLNFSDKFQEVFSESKSLPSGPPTTTTHSKTQLRVHDRFRRSAFPGWKQDTAKYGLTEEERLAVLHRHNELRGNPTPTATNMRFLIWDEGLTTVAQAWADGCDFKHNYGNDYGENLSSQSSYYNESIMVDNWFNEGNSYTYSSHSCSTSTCGHYHQVVLAESMRMGCGMKFCTSMATITMSNAYFLVCNYDPAQNKGSSQPYEDGISCSNCPVEMPLCEKKLCRRDPFCSGLDLSCNNGGLLKMDICECNCTGAGYNDATCGPAPSSSTSSEGASNNTSSEGASNTTTLSPDLVTLDTPVGSSYRKDMKHWICIPFFCSSFLVYRLVI